jgi:hypothetical protein
MEFKDLVALYFERTNAMQTLWSIYITIVLGLLGFLGTVKLATNSFLMPLFLTIAFVGFATVNMSALRSVTTQRNIVANLIHSSQFDGAINSVAQSKIAASLDPPSVLGLTLFHLGGDALTLVGIWVLVLKVSK